jgi:long-chain fatty acid transport protein
MRRNVIIFSMLLFTLSTLPANALGSGFYSGDQSAAATGMATAVVASVSDASAVYFNPAALNELEGARVMGGVTVYDVSGTFNSDDGTSADLENSPIPLPHLYASWKAGQKLAFGLGVFSDFGLATDWQDDWSGRFILGSTDAESMAVNLNPVVAYAISPRELPESS